MDSKFHVKLHKCFCEFFALFLVMMRTNSVKIRIFRYISVFHNWRPYSQSSNLHRNESNHSREIKARIWDTIRRQGEDIARREVLLKKLIEETILQHNCFGDALAYRLATKLGGMIVSPTTWINVFREAMSMSRELGDEYDIEKLAMEDMIACDVRDPACRTAVQAFLFFKGYKAIQSHRYAHILWIKKRHDLSYLIQARCAEVFGVDIHPGAILGGGLMVDHASGVVIGETAVIGRNCSILHGVTLGGTGNQLGDRHPK